MAARSATGQRGKARAGKLPGGAPPLGYRSEDGELVADAAETALIRRVVGLVVGGKTTGQVAALLAAEGVTGRNGGRMTHQSIRRMLTSRALLGEVIWGKPGTNGEHRTRVDARGKPLWGEPVAWRVDPILTETEWAALQRSLAARAHGPKKEHHVYALSGMLFCSCGEPFGGQVQRAKRKYRCRAHRWHADPAFVACGMPPLLADEVEARVWGELFSALANPSRLQRAVRDARETAGADAEAAAAELASARRALGTAREGLTTTLAAAMRAGAAPEIVEAAVRASNAEQDALRSRIVELEAKVGPNPAPAADHLEALVKVAGYLAGPAPEPERLRQILSLAGVRIQLSSATKDSELTVTADVVPAALAAAVSHVNLGAEAPRHPDPEVGVRIRLVA
jgi:site-specific DNA recombinase